MQFSELVCEQSLLSFECLVGWLFTSTQPQTNILEAYFCGSFVKASASYHFSGWLWENSFKNATFLVKEIVRNNITVNDLHQTHQSAHSANSDSVGSIFCPFPRKSSLP